MGRLLTLTRSNTVDFGTRKSAFKPQVKVGKKSIGFITVFLFLALSLFYLAQANEIATKGYAIRELEQRKTKAVEQQERLQVEAARLRSIQQIEKGAEELKMVPASEINYVNPDGSVAKK